MAAEAQDIARRGLDLFNRGDLDQLDALIDENMQATVPVTLPNAGVYLGHAGFRRMVEQWQEAWEDFRVEVESAEPHGDDAVLVSVIQHGRGRGSGVEASMPAVYLMRVRAGRVVDWRMCATRDEALAHVVAG